MVEPQDHIVTPAADEEPVWLYEFEKKHNESVQRVGERMQAMKALKQEASKKVLELCELFTNFEAEEKNKFKECSVF